MAKRGQNKKSNHRYKRHRGSSYEKNLANFKLLVSDPDFAKTVVEIREFLKLPPNGYSDLGNQENELQEWWGQIYKQSNDIFYSRQFNDRIRHIKENEPSPSMAKKNIDLAHKEIPINYLTMMINDIIKEYNLPINYEKCIQRYIISGTVISVPAATFSVVSYDEDPKVRLFEKVTVEFYSKIKDDDLAQLKHVINDSFFGKRLLESLEPARNVDIKLKIEEEKLNNELRFDGAEQKMRKNTAKDIAEIVSDIQGVPVTTNQVYDSKREMKRLRSRFKKKSGK